MKKWALALLCVLLAASVLCGGAAWMLLTPRGMLREDKPEDVMQNAMDSMSREDWRDLYLSGCSVDTGEFEDSAKVTGDILRFRNTSFPRAARTWRAPGSFTAKGAGILH